MPLAAWLSQIMSHHASSAASWGANSVTGDQPPPVHFHAPAGVQMEAVFGDQHDDVSFRGQQPLADAHPVAEIATELEIGEEVQQVAGDPRVVQDAAGWVSCATATPISRCGQDLGVKLLALPADHVSRPPWQLMITGFNAAARASWSRKDATCSASIAAGRENLGDIAEPVCRKQLAKRARHLGQAPRIRRRHNPRP